MAITFLISPRHLDPEIPLDHFLMGREIKKVIAIGLFLLFLLHSVVKTFCLLLWFYILRTASLLQLLHDEEETSIACARVCTIKSVPN